jgi:hypothetical protein
LCKVRRNFRCRFIIDRFEGEFAVVELPDRTMVNIPKILVPGAKEGDVLNITIDSEATDDRKNKIMKLMDEVWK